ncbi:hypothetical protein ACRALDRAFT_1078969 [Sodiomyces alcalophilus JCM 7366]|uniref:uncharacterized protein n=1 Tax=Sodiomyces alcalophilus JCM 7366 TaxID=591952 RepID=UPI0039B620AA
MMDSSPPTKTQEPTLPVAGTKRPAPSLLPPFEPLSSSPSFPRPLKRQARPGSVGSSGAYLKYPTPVPTSSTGILSSSPPRVGLGLSPSQQHGNNGTWSQGRHGLSERAPLASVPAVELNENGDTLLLGRSSNSSHYQLSGNRLVSRVHVRARYIPASTPLEPNKVEIVCHGWNGLKLHCQGRTWELLKGDSFTSETEGTEIMVDVHDARVMIQWPRKDARGGNLSDSSWDDSPRSMVRGSGASGLQSSPSSPLRRAARIKTPESPTPGVSNLASSQRIASLLPGGDEDGEIHIFEDPNSEDDAEKEEKEEEESRDVGQSFVTEVTNSFSSDLSEPDEDEDDNNGDPDEENDPIVHSFGPFGADLSNRLASITATSPRNPAMSPTKPRSRNPLFANNQAKAASRSLAAIREALSPKKKDVEMMPKEENTAVKKEADGTSRDSSSSSLLHNVDVPTIRNHVVNQLAFSRLSSSPLSAILGNLPADERRDLDTRQLQAVIEATPCIGIITRQGKDAAGQPLESQCYYIPEADEDEQRRLAVTDGLRKPSLRACRKQHKQYYWKRPRTP